MGVEFLHGVENFHLGEELFVQVAKKICKNLQKCSFSQVFVQKCTKVPIERYWSLDASIFTQNQQTVPHIKADIFS